MAVVREFKINAEANIDSNVEEFGNEVSGAASDVDKLVDSVSELAKEQKKANELAEKSAKDIKKSNDNAAKSTKGVGTAFKALGGAIKAAGIGLVIGLFVSMKEVLGQNQAVLDFFSSTMTTINIVVNEAVDVFNDVFDSVSESTGGFDALGKVLSGVVTLAITPFKVAFDGIRLIIANTQLAWEKSVFGGQDADTILELQGNIESIKESLVETGEEALYAGAQIADNFVEAFDEVKEAAVGVVDGLSEIDIAASKLLAEQITARKNAAVIAEAVNRGLIEQADVAAELQRQIRDDESKSIAERKAANEELGRVLEQQMELMQENAALVVQAARDQVSLNDNIENQVALQEALNEQDAISARVVGFQSEQKVNKIALLKEERELLTSVSQTENEIAISAAQFDAERIKNIEDRQQAQRDALAEEKALEQERLNNLISTLEEGTQARVDAQNELAIKNEEYRQRELELETTQAEELKEVNKKALEDEKKVRDAKLEIAAGTFAAIANIADAFAGESEKSQRRAFKIQKAAGIANATIQTYQSAVAAFNSLASIPVVGVGLGTAAAALAVANGIANVKRISSQQFGGGGNGGTPSVPNLSNLSGGGASSAPSFNVVGETSADANQITGAIAAGNSQPVKAYVLGKDVTSQQEMDRNLVDAASI